MGKPLVIACNEVTAVKLSHVTVCAWHTNGVESVVFNTSVDEMQSDSNQNVQSFYYSYVGGPAVPGASGPTILKKKIPGTPHFSGNEREKDTVQFEQWLHAISYARKNFNEQLAINKSCMGDVADAICCLPSGATLDDIIEKFKWLYGSLESFDTFMQEFYRIVQGKMKRFRHLTSILRGLLR